jgi:hypothetical protein
MPSKKIEQELKRLCEAVDFRSRHSAAIFKGNTPLAYGVNRDKTHPLCSYYGKNPEAIYLHAELDAIVKVLNTRGPKALAGATIAVCRVTRDGNFAASKPCEGCERAIKAFGLKVQYTTREGWANAT